MTRDRTTWIWSMKTTTTAKVSVTNNKHLLRRAKRMIFQTHHSKSKGKETAARRWSKKTRVCNHPVIKNNKTPRKLTNQMLVKIEWMTTKKMGTSRMKMIHTLMWICQLGMRLANLHRNFQWNEIRDKMEVTQSILIRSKLIMLVLTRISEWIYWEILVYKYYPFFE